MAFSALCARATLIAMARLLEKETFVSVSGIGDFLIDVPAGRAAVLELLKAARGRSSGHVIPILGVPPGRTAEEVLSAPPSGYLLDAGRLATDILLTARVMGIPALLAAGHPSEVKEHYPGAAVHYAVALQGAVLAVSVREFRYDATERTHRVHVLFEGDLDAFAAWAKGPTLKVVSGPRTPS
jgi:hypothetical protein